MLYIKSQSDLQQVSDDSIRASISLHIQNSNISMMNLIKPPCMGGLLYVKMTMI